MKKTEFNLRKVKITKKDYMIEWHENGKKHIVTETLSNAKSTPSSSFKESLAAFSEELSNVYNRAEVEAHGISVAVTDKAELYYISGLYKFRSGKTIGISSEGLDVNNDFYGFMETIQKKFQLVKDEAFEFQFRGKQADTQVKMDLSGTTSIGDAVTNMISDQEQVEDEEEEQEISEEVIDEDPPSEDDPNEPKGLF